MGMFDPIKLFEEHFQEGEAFTLTAARVGKPVSTEYGERKPVLLKIDGAVYSIIGDAVLAQVDRMEAGDLPARVALIRQESTREGRSPAKVLVPVDANGQPVRPAADDDIPF